MWLSAFSVPESRVEFLKADLKRNLIMKEHINMSNYYKLSSLKIWNKKV